MNLQTILSDYLDHIHLARGFSIHTRKAYERDILRFFEYHTNCKQVIESLDNKTCRQYLYSLDQSGLNPRSIARSIAALRSFWHFLISRNLAKKNPWDMVKSPRISQQLPEVLYHKEMNRFLESISTDRPLGLRNRLICELLYCSGMRISELTNMNLDDFSLARKEIRIFGKGKKERIIFAGSRAHVLAHTWLDQVRPLIATDDNPAFFLNRHGNRLSTRTIQRFIKDHAAKNRINKQITPHLFRHSFATAMLEGGADIRAVQELLGHSSLTSTQIYTHLSADMLNQTVQTSHPLAQDI